MPNATEVVADPTKEFFVSMITRDIRLEDCILDLIDNSIDSAWRQMGSVAMTLSNTIDLSHYTIRLGLTPTAFSIVDNCGGISRNVAEQHAFSFGRKSGGESSPYGIGVYGIGMKRAVFKIGKIIRIRSTTTVLDSGTDAFCIDIDVPTWLENDSDVWRFPISSDVPLDHDGVDIHVSDLHESVAALFSSSTFLEQLRRTISRDYALHLERGLKIIVNDEPIVGWQVLLSQSTDFAPMRTVQSLTSAAGDLVEVEIIGGMAAEPPDDYEPHEDEEGDKRFGWYVACNGRIVVAADKSMTTGWGTTDWPQWHPQYSGFIGLVVFTSEKTLALPLTTTKRGIDSSSEVYKQALVLMRSVTKSWIAYTNQRKQSIEAAKQVESLASKVPIAQIPTRSEVLLPTLEVPAVARRMATVNYAVARDRLRLLAAAFGDNTMSYRDVGLKSFEYSFGDLVGEDE